MGMNECPNCGKQAMSPMRKVLMGPGRAVECVACGQKVSVPWWSIFPIALPAALIGVVVPFPEMLIVLVIFTIIIIPPWLYFVPVVKRG